MTQQKEKRKKNLAMYKTTRVSALDLILMFYIISKGGFWEVGEFLIYEATLILLINGKKAAYPGICHGMIGLHEGKSHVNM